MLINKLSQQKGFTIVEVAIIVPLMSLMVASLVVALVTLITNIAIEAGANALTYETKSVVDQLEKDVGYGSTFAETTLPANFNSGTLPSDSSQTAPRFYKNAGTTAGYPPSGSVRRTLVIQSYDQAKNPNGSASAIPVVLGTPPCANQFEVSPAATLPIAIVYFVDKGTLYRSIIPDNTNNASQLCNTPIYKKNCPTTPSDCAPRNTALLSGVTTFEINYFLTPSSSSLGSGVYGGTYPTGGQSPINLANTIEVTIVASKRVSGKDLNYSLTSRFTRPH